MTGLLSLVAVHPTYLFEVALAIEYRPSRMSVRSVSTNTTGFDWTGEMKPSLFHFLIISVLPTLSSKKTVALVSLNSKKWMTAHRQGASVGHCAKDCAWLGHPWVQWHLGLSLLRGPSPSPMFPVWQCYLGECLATWMPGVFTTWTLSEGWGTLTSAYYLQEAM